MKKGVLFFVILIIFSAGFVYAVLRGDASGNGVVDIADYQIWKTNIGQTGGIAKGNFNSDTIIDGKDYAIWFANFGQIETPTPTPSAASCGANEIVCENKLPGTPRSVWDIGTPENRTSLAGDSTIQGFSTEISVNKGEPVKFKIDTDSKNYKIDIYRLGFYGGDGARKITTITPAVTLPQNQPECTTSGEGLVDCVNWAESASWQVPQTAVSGVYIAKLTRADGSKGASHIPFIVRDDTGNSDILLQTSDTTWHAYNPYGGNSFYKKTPSDPRTPSYLYNHVPKISYNRPIISRGIFRSNLFSSEYPTIRFLEANGFDVSYSTGVDTDKRGAELLDHKIFISSGHDEYWSKNQRTNVENARNSGVNLAFLSGNEVYWKTYFENNHRTLVSYKDTHANAIVDPLPGIWTGTWRDPRFSPPEDGGKPENALTGTLWMISGPADAYAENTISVPAQYGKLRFWRNTDIANLPPSQTATLVPGILGYEWDIDANNGFRPAGLIKLSSSPFSFTTGTQVLLTDWGNTLGYGDATHNLTLYKAPSGALVFGAGTVQWSWGLDQSRDSTIENPQTALPADKRMQQVMLNLFADMNNVQPGSIQPGLIKATKTTDVSRPTSQITTPVSGTTLQKNQAVTISGKATDQGGVVGGVEISTNGGTRWHPANGTENWSYSWTPTQTGSTTIKTRATDDSGNIQSPPTSVTVTIN